jgi:c-di-GMP-related signal transduction protein
MSTVPDAPVLIARQPIVDGRRTVFAYELFDPTQAADKHTAASDIALVFHALAHTGSEVLVGQFTIFVHATHDGLAGGHLDLVQPERVVLEIPPVEGDEPAVIESRAPALAEMRRRGFRLALNQTVLKSAYAPWLVLADFIKLDLSTIDPMRLPALLQLAKARTGARLIAVHTETAADYEQLSGYGVDLFQGFWFSQVDLIQTRVVPPAQAMVIQLINLVRSQASTDAIEEVLKKDAMLGFNLMRLINSAGFGLAREITSFRQAVMLLGLRRLFRWAALLLTASRVDGAPPVVGTTAVVRGRFMELLAADYMTQDDCDSAFVVGVFSLLDVMLCMPMAQAVQLLALPQDVVDALLHGTGPYAELLALARSCEAGDDRGVMRTAESLHLSNRQINQAHLDALAWSDALVE